MGKKSKTAAAKSPGAGGPGPLLADEADIKALIDKAAELKVEANTLFTKKEFAKALEVYQLAAATYPHDHAEKPQMLCNKAACYTMLRKPKEAAKECSNALAIAPGNAKALLWRSKAYEAQGLYKQALSDVQAINKTADASADTQSAEQRLKDIMSGKMKPTAIQSTRPTAKPGLAGRQQQQQLPQFTAKCTYGDDTRVIYLNHNTTYPELINQVKQKFPNAGNVAVKYKDKEGDSITVTTRNDIHAAMAEALSNMDRRAVQGTPTIPPVRFQVVKAVDQAEEVFELDDWLIDFANLFREHLGIGPDRHVDLHNEGWEKCTQALDAAVQDDKAGPLFDQAAVRFAEVTASGLYHWGNVHMCKARKAVDSLSASGKSVEDIADLIKDEFDHAEKKYQEALGYKSDFYDGAVGMGQLYFERAKLHTGLLIPSSPAGAEGTKEAQEIANQLMKEALTKVTNDKAKVAEELFEQAVEYFKSAITMLPAEDPAAAPKPAGENGEVEEISFRAQALVMWGNVLYEQSQVRATVGKEWKPLLDEAVRKFNEAGCQKADIRTALLNHLKKDEIDIPPELQPEEKPVEPEKPAAEKAEEKPADAPKGGLTALAPQKKKANKK
mmetsp:Transcript_5803/g.16302  ORF Transcript_5803/g.16302 Transcript_5803/m.16302 type:complete len:613 (-) Transcript_5803:272-2110(-)|eukprot:CAMPEP_0117688894 /NCGR_PEP_ID=MMETSP0804-20121206/24126_1 /TAXON_ID=1074897 /ORGANISM="Tetraselmis astigmatica, Strain CCMP880" /LENGTH=612 /DNA_ID=CAMNT_0005501483 /DNA_START=33 /DNA_END=1871 /DNA_ORIENTATION=-